MKIKSVIVEDNNTGKQPTKRLIAKILLDDGKTKNVYFGMKNSAGTFYDLNDSVKKENYIKRHAKAGEDWTDPLTAGFWSRWFLWEKYGKVPTRILMTQKVGAPVTIGTIEKY